MLSKLIKHEFKASYRVYLPIYLTIIGISLLQYLANALDLVALKYFLLSMGMFGIGGLGIFTLYNLIIAMGQRVYGKPGYLLFSIPAKTSEIIASKMITHFIWMLVTIVVFLFGFTTMFVTIGEFSSLAYLWDEIITSNIWTFWSVLSVILTPIIYMIYFLSFFMFLFAFLNLVYKGSHKVLMGIVIYFVLETVLSLFTTIPMEFVFLNSMFGVGSPSGINSIWLFFGIFTLISAGLIGATYYIIHKKMELQ